MKGREKGRPVGAVVTDFDGTIMMEDVSLLVLKLHGLPGWEDLDKMAETGEMPLEESLTRQYLMVRARSVEEILSGVRGHYRLREGFLDLAARCKEGNIPLVVVSAGLDFCIEDAFRSVGFAGARIVCPRTTFSPEGIKARFPPYRPPSRDFKEEVVRGLADGGARTVYFGDGYSDYFASSQAGTVFAVRGSLLERRCNSTEIPCVPFDSFAESFSLFG